MGAPVELWRWDQPIVRLAETLAAGGVVVIPTESSYALGVDPTRGDAVERVFAIKGRPSGKPLPVVLGSIAHLERLGVRLPPGGLGGLEKGWPGPLTLLLPCASGLAAAAGAESLAVRIPGHERLRRLLDGLGFALTATSANRSGQRPITEVAAAVELVSGQPAVVVDDGRLPGGEPSTMVAFTARGASVVRQGRVSRARLAELAPQWFSAGAVEIPVEDHG